MSACWWWRFCLVHFGRFSEMREKVLSLQQDEQSISCCAFSEEKLGRPF
jgi:hypothetical protein